MCSLERNGRDHAVLHAEPLPVTLVDLFRAKVAAVPEPPFTSAALSGAFYAEAVRPLLSGRLHAAALLGWGSDVLGYDTERSTDHGWGPRLLVFLDDEGDIQELDGVLAARLPEQFRGWPVRYGWDEHPIRHQVTVTTLEAWLVDFLGVDARAGMSTLDWLLTPQQRLLGVTAGRVYSDDGGALSQTRVALSWFSEQVWRWLLACQWHRLAQEEAFVARTAQAGDEAGSALTAARLVRDMIRLALMLDRRYAPYQKWLGTAFARCHHSDGLPKNLDAALRASDLQERESALAAAYTILARRHNASGMTEQVEPSTREYHDRPARVLMADRFAEALLATIPDSPLAALPLLGSVDQLIDSTDVLSTPEHYRRLAALYDGLEARTSR